MSTRRILPSHATLMRNGQPFCAIDASSLRGDAFAWLSGYVTADLVAVTQVAAVEGAELLRTTMADVLARVAESARSVGAWRVLGDQREAGSMPSLLAPHALAFREYPWSEPSKDAAVQVLRRLMRERALALPPCPKLRAELLAMKARLVPSGRIRYDHAGDRASALVTVAHAIAAGDLPMAGPLSADSVYVGATSSDDDERRLQIARAARWGRDLPAHLAERRPVGRVFDHAWRGWK